MAEDIREVIKNTLGDRGKPVRTLKLGYDAPSASLESVYFWILDFAGGFSKDIEKVTDNFMASPGSSHFAEMGARTTRMQEEGMKIMGVINQLIKTVINLIYDLKEFEIRISQYDDAKSESKLNKEQGNLALKQIWMDNVDMKKGRGSINQMTYELGFSTLRDVFMMANSFEDVDNMAKDGLVNDR